jgi:hypothetical protein
MKAKALRSFTNVWMMNLGHEINIIAVVTALLMNWRQIVQETF